MTAKNLNDLLDGKITTDSFTASISSEIETYAELMMIKGSTIELRFLEDETIELDNVKFKKLLYLVLYDELSNIHLAYICDCLTLSEDLVVDEIAKEFIFE